MENTVLKPKFSLKGKNLLPIASRVRASMDGSITDFARLRKDHPLTRYTVEELVEEYERLFGEDVGDTCLLTGLDTSIEDNMRLVMHCAIVHANAVGAPKGQVLLPKTTQGPGPSGMYGGSLSSLSPVILDIKI